MKVAIVLLNWNGKHWLEKFLPNIIEYSQEAHIYVIDNASTDDSVAFVKKYFPTVQVIQNAQNFGFAGGYNEGLKQIDEEIYCLLNSDVEVTENWLEPVKQLFQRDNRIAAIQPKVLSYYEKSQFEFAGAAGGFMDNLGYPYCRGRIFDSVEEDKGQYNDEIEIFWASGCCFFIRRKDFWEVSGFDERFFAHQEEIDLCWRLFNLGKKIYYTGQSTIYHVGGGTLNKQSPRKTFLNMRNNLSMLLKNLPVKTLIWVLPFRLVLDGIAGIYFGLKNGFSHFLAVLKAHFSFYAQSPKTWQLRGEQPLSNYYQTKWLIFKHFLK
ncbi:MAG: glycosyltransferase family 2 protein [Cloacibacterium sp.]|nr:glycosyltransferase family 2 protein [Cloacibacterium sp.]